MEGGGGSYRVEAERWLTISEKLLVARDLQGAKTFAIRARESDPRLLQFSDQIITVADTLLAAELRVKDHNNGTEIHDYYALLQLARLTHSMELIATQYRKLALILNPTRNRFAYADQAFGLVSDAWMLFSNPQRKAMYDLLLQPVQLGLSAAQFAANQGFMDAAAVLPQSPARRSSRINNNSDGSVVVDPELVTTTNQWVPVSTQSTRQSTKQEHQFTNSPAAAAPTVSTQAFLPQQTRPLAQQMQQPISTESPRPTQPVWISQQPAAKPAVAAQSQPAKETTASSTSKVAPQRSTPEAVTPFSFRPAAPQQSPPLAATPVSSRPAAAPVAATPVSTRPAAETPQQKQSSQPQGPSFWTACPYCFNLYEYLKVYEECALKCQSCKRGFHAVAIASPPVSSKDSYFCCWGFFPLGYMGGSKDSELGGRNWSPFSAMFSTPVQPGVNYKAPTSAAAAAAADAGKAPPRPKVIYKDDVYIDLSDPSDDDDDKSDSDDDDWDRTVKKAKTTTPPARRGRPPTKNVKKGVRGRKRAISRNVDGSGSSNGAVRDQVITGEGSSSGRKSKGGKDLGKLDLNVMFSNEVEEAAAGVSSEGNEPAASHGGVEDNIEGIGFFEGLDEFLSSLPILSVVDEKVKAN